VALVDSLTRALRRGLKPPRAGPGQTEMLYGEPKAHRYVRRRRRVVDLVGRLT